MKRSVKLYAWDVATITLLASLAGCPLQGCAFMSSPQNAAKLSNPSLRIEKRGSNVILEAGTEMSGKVKAKYDPTTGALDIDAEVNSSPSPVIAAETERARTMEAFYAMQMAALTAQTQMTTGMVNNLVGALSTVAGAALGIPVPHPAPPVVVPVPVVPAAVPNAPKPN